MPRYRAIPRPVMRDLRSMEPVAESKAEPEPDYRDLQAQAKAAGIPANQSREDLEAALSDD